MAFALNSDSVGWEQSEPCGDLGHFPGREGISSVGIHFPEVMMDTTKLGACLFAAVITLAGVTFLARPAQAVESAGECTSTQRAYADGYADGACGSGGGSVTSCVDNGNGGFSFAWMCNPI